MSILQWLSERKEDREGNEKTAHKLDIPGDLWIKCFKCNEIIYNKDLEENQKVCPKCDYHFRLSAQERKELLIDPGTFEEHFQQVGSKDILGFSDLEKYNIRIQKAQAKNKTKEAVITGKGQVEGMTVGLAVMDFAYMGGSMNSGVGEKITRMIEMATQKKWPMIIVSSSGGARMQEGIFSLMQMAKTSAALARLAEAKLPFISILTDPTTGGTTASFAMLGDIHLAEPGALIGFAGPRVIEQTIRQKLPKGFQTSEYLQEHGMVDLVVHRLELKAKLAQILRLLVG